MARPDFRIAADRAKRVAIGFPERPQQQPVTARNAAMNLSMFASVSPAMLIRPEPAI
jgi:hypothetical protein